MYVQIPPCSFSILLDLSGNVTNLRTSGKGTLAYITCEGGGNLHVKYRQPPSSNPSGEDTFQDLPAYSVLHIDIDTIFADSTVTRVHAHYM